MATLGTQNTGGRQTKQKTQYRKLKRWATQNPGAHEGWSVPASYKTPPVLYS